MRTLLLLLALSTSALAEEQTRIYDVRGNSIGTATREDDGTVRFRDARGSTTGTSTTTPGGGTTFYDPRGSVTGRDFGPCPAGSLACGRSR